jgi:hypothetical protein
MSVVNRAVKDSKEIARLAVDAAKNELVEQISPAIKRLIESRLREGVLGEDVDRLRRSAEGQGETEFEEGKKPMEDDKMESVASLFPGVNEVSEAEDCMDEAEVPTLGEGEDMDDEMQEGADAPVDETIELSESELEAMYNEALQLEVDVSKGFKPIAEPHELGGGSRNDNTGEAAALADKKSGEHQWDDEVPPAKQDYSVKEIRQLVRRGMAENKALKARAAKAETMVRALHGKLVEMNLLNSKILHVNKFMSQHRLNNEQKKTVIESIDMGKTINEVKNIFGTLESAFRVAGVVSESKNKTPRADTGKRRTSGAPDAKVLRESADKAEGGGQYDRMRQLAGLSKLTNG